MLDHKKQNVLMIGWYFYPEIGGVETIMINLAKFLVGKGFCVSVLTSKKEDQPTDEIWQGIRIIRRPFITTRKQISKEEVRRNIKKVIDEIKPDIVHFHNGSFPSAATDVDLGVANALIIFDALRQYSIPIVEHAHNAQIREEKKTKPLRMNDWDYLIFVSNYVKTRWQSLGVDTSKSSVVYNGIDYELFARSKPILRSEVGCSDNDVVIFFPTRVINMTTGRLADQKNFALILDACEKLTAEGISNYKVVAINTNPVEGSGNDSRRELKKIVNDKHLENHIVLIPKILPEKMPGYYATADIVCVPSYNETFGLTYVEAMASGKVAIASNTGAPQEYIGHGKTGFLVDPKNPHKLYAILKNLINNHSLGLSIGNNAKEKAKTFSTDEMGKNIINIYGKLL